MKTTKLKMAFAALALACASQVARADFIPYPASGTPNSTVYTFTATGTGPITAYFAGSTATYDNELGLLINGVSTGVIGLDNHTSALGQSLVLGNATAGDTLTFVLQNNTLGANVYSDPTMNTAYDVDGSVGHQHVYATPYTQTTPLLGTIPKGTYVAFEDLRFPSSDFNYHDETFVFTGVSAVPEPSTYIAGVLLTLPFGFQGIRALRNRKQAA